MPARLRILGWIVLTAALGLGILLITVRTALLSEVARAANADVVQEIEEFQEFVGESSTQELDPAYHSLGALLEAYLRQQRPGEGEVLLGYDGTSEEVITTRGADAQGPYDLSRDGNFLREVLDAASASGVADSPAGEIRWGRVDLETPDPGGDRGALVVAQLTRGAVAQVDHISRIIAAVGSGALLLISGIAWLVAGRILKPVRLVRQTAARITERDLTRRIPVQGRDDIAALATTFNGMLDRLEHAFETQRQFVDDAGHELRTPITIIHGHLELLSEDPQERESTITLVLDELTRMNRIVTDLLLLAKSERPDFVLVEEVDVGGLTLDIEAKVAALGDRRWTLADVADGTAHLDPQRVIQAMLQLAQNAVDHTEPGSEIRIASRLRSNGAQTMEFSIRDFGPGVRAADAERIFERFAHGTQSNPLRDRPGAGLGLAIVRAIADGHGGAAFVRSEEDGVTFGIAIPVSEGRRSAGSETYAPRTREDAP